MRILVCGDRHWTDQKFIYSKLAELLGEFGPDITIIHGAAKGADSIGGTFARFIGLPVLPFPAEWDKYRRAAGPIRNQQMIDEAHPDLVIAFHDRLPTSKGTWDMITRARKANIPVRIYQHDCDL